MNRILTHLRRWMWWRSKTTITVTSAAVFRRGDLVSNGPAGERYTVTKVKGDSITVKRARSKT